MTPQVRSDEGVTRGRLDLVGWVEAAGNGWASQTALPANDHLWQESRFIGGRAPPAIRFARPTLQIRRRPRPRKSTVRAAPSEAGPLPDCFPPWECACGAADPVGLIGSGAVSCQWDHLPTKHIGASGPRLLPPVMASAAVVWGRESTNRLIARPHFGNLCRLAGFFRRK